MSGQDTGALELEADEAFYLPNLTAAVWEGAALRVVRVRVVACSRRKQLAQVRLPNGGKLIWVPYTVLASTRAKLEGKLRAVAELAVRPVVAGAVGGGLRSVGSGGSAGYVG